jgi:sterol desaturase/sphingolipid hydroxylase (fatty acid hydroxylase superfamily)
MKLEDALLLAVPATYLFMLAVEKRFPAREFPKVRRWDFIGVGFMILTMSLAVITPLLLPVDWLATHRLVDGTRVGVAAGVAVGFVTVELGVYIYHRACHRFTFMWRTFHQMHHSAERLDIPGSVVFHPFELFAQNVLSIGITVFVLGLDPVAAAMVGYVVSFSALFQHWNVNTPRWVGFILQRPEAHCLHHAYNLHAYNYADLPLLDIIFGTFRNPATFVGRVGFEQKPVFGKMLMGVDISRGDGTRYLTRSPSEGLEER